MFKFKQFTKLRDWLWLSKHNYAGILSIFLMELRSHPADTSWMPKLFYYINYYLCVYVCVPLATKALRIIPLIRNKRWSEQMETQTISCQSGYHYFAAPPDLHKNKPQLYDSPHLDASTYIWGPHNTNKGTSWGVIIFIINYHFNKLSLHWGS